MARGGCQSLIALGFGALLHGTGLVLDSVVVALCLTTTALGTLLPIVRDAGILRTPLGPSMLSVGAIGEFGPIVAVAVLLTNRDARLTFVLLVLFVGIAVVAALLAVQVRPPRFVALLRRHLNSTAQLPVRICVLLVILLVYLAIKLSLDVLLGAFAAGVVVRLFIKGEDSQPVESKLEAIGFGFLIPIFFIESGINFDLGVTHPSSPRPAPRSDVHCHLLGDPRPADLGVLSGGDFQGGGPELGCPCCDRVADHRCHHHARGR